MTTQDQGKGQQLLPQEWGHVDDVAETLDALACGTREHSLNGEQHNHLREAAEMLRAWRGFPQPVGQSPIELGGISEALANGSGLWMTCTGCHESNEGVPTGPYSAIMRCHLGSGCSECGGIGAIWDTTDYQQMADEMARSLNRYRIVQDGRHVGDIEAVDARVAATQAVETYGCGVFDVSLVRGADDSVEWEEAADGH